ncbi:hypothetical protein [Algibacter pacificus]|uniref:hypothetical protein n=1 Tax=Algibacter pacificus TaxID=2599389 RepID=UPI0011C77381|nr:hypothetical protein [Algibacter pacificus]
MTNNIADFNDHCTFFDLDKSEFEKYQNRFKNEINENYATNNFEKFFTESSFVKPTNSRNSKFKSVAQTHNLNFKNDIAFDKAILILMCLAGLYVFFVNYSDIINATVKNEILIGFAFMCIFMSVLAYRVYFMQHKTKISITKNGIEYHGNTLYWNNIVDYGILRANSTSVNEHKIIIGTITKGIVEIDLTALNISPEEFIDIIRLNTKKRLIA